MTLTEWNETRDKRAAPMGAFPFHDHRSLAEARRRGRQQKIDYQQLEDLWKTGVPVAEIAHQLDSTVGSVRVTACNLGLGARVYRPSRGLAAQWAEIAEAYRSASAKNVAARYGCTVQAVLNICRRLRVPIRPRSFHLSKGLNPSALAGASGILVADQESNPEQLCRVESGQNNGGRHA